MENTVIAELGEYKKASRMGEIWRRFKKSKGAMIGLVVLLIVFAVLLLADVIAPYNLAIKQNSAKMLKAPSTENIMGTDLYGRDVFARILHGGRTSLSIAVVTTIGACVIGSTLGAIAGYFGGLVDSIIMRALDILMSIPEILLTMAVVVALGSSFVNLFIALTIAYFSNYVRLVRAPVLSLAENDYTEAARAGGSSDARIIITHIIPNALGIIIVNITLNVAKVILYESTLSFLGLGMPPPHPAWGLMLSEAREFMSTCPYLVFFPAAAIVLCACSINLVGDGLRDALDPHLKS